MDILISIAAKVCEYTVAPVGRQLGYLFFYKQNVEDLKTQIVDLGHVKERLQHEVETAQNNAREIEADVNDWLAKADKIITEDHGDFTRHEEHANTKFTCGAKFPNLVLRHRLSRRATKMAQTVAAQIKDGNTFKQVSYRLNLPISVGNKGYEDFESRNQTLTNVMEALRDPTIDMVGVWGMGGVGKTMLTKEVARRATDEEKLFTESVFTTISKEQNIKDIQQDIGEKLRMRFDGETKDARADQLRNRLREENNKILIIVDDIWGKLDLEAVGISYGGINQQGCKILLTTRSRHVLANDMGVANNFEVGLVWEHEAKSLFRKIVGDQAEKQELQGLASEIVEECGGLPIAITTVASALKNKKCAVWKSALHGLRNANPGNIPGMEKEVYNSIKFSIDCLDSVEAKHLLLLCSLFPEDAKIPIRVLCDYGFGLNLFKGVNTLESARINTEALVTNLKDHSLLLDADSYDGYECVKLHDVIRDVVILIASNYKLDEHHHRMHNIKNADELEMFKDSTAISLYGIEANQYPQTLKGPELNLLRLVCSHDEDYDEELPGQFFEELDMLLVLDCENTSLGNIAFSLLPNLQTLRLTCECILGDISWIGELKSLKILDLSFNSSITELPRGIGKLTRLLSLNLEGCSNLKVIEPNVISSLTRLEELNLKDSFTNWEEVEGVANAGDERRNANLNELKELPRLVDLKLEVPDINSLPKDIFSENLEKYCINIGDYKGDEEDGENNTSKTLKLRLCPNSAVNEHDFAALVGRSEALYLSGLKIAKSVAFEIDRMGFQRLKHLTVKKSNEIRCIVNSNNGNMNCTHASFPSLESLLLKNIMNLENIIHEKLTTETSFGKLREIQVYRCDKLKSLFSLSNIPRQLEKIVVWNCTMMEEIISHDGDHVEKIEIYQLRELYLSRLPKLLQFIATSKSDEIKREGRQSIDAPLFNEQVICVLFPRLESLGLYDLPNLERFCGGHISLPELKSLELCDLPNLERFCGGDCVDYPSLSKLAITGCQKLKVICVLFPRLESLRLDDLPNLKRFCGGDFSLHKLQSLNLYGLPNLERFCGGDISLPELKSLKLYRLSNLERFCGGKISLHKLQSLNLRDLPNLERFCGGDCVDCPSLSELAIRDCQKLKVFKTNTMPNTATKKEKQNSTGSVAYKQLLSHHKDVASTSRPHPLGSVEEHDEYLVFKTKRSSKLKLWNLPNQQQLPKTFPTLELLNIAEWGIISQDLATPLMSFQNLKVLVVKDCLGLASLFSPSTAKSLSQRLTKLGISGCKSLGQVIANDDDDDNIKIIFSQLESLVLDDLSNLTSFYLGNNNVVLQFPRLARFIVGCCPEMKTFCDGNIHCPSLHSITLSKWPREQWDLILWNYEMHYERYLPGDSCWKGDINTTIQKLWEDEYIYYSPETKESIETCKQNVDNAEEVHVVGPQKKKRKFA